MRTLKIDYIDFLTTFYKEANVNKAKPSTDIFGRIYDKVRKHLEKT
jgi:hypothetical protein